MTKRSRIATAAFFLLLLLLSAGVFAQGTTGQLTGKVTQNGPALPGVTVTVTSPNLQGTRTTVTNENGEYNFGALPPGNYAVTFALEGMQTVTKRTNVALLQTARVDAGLKMTAVAEAITVTASAPTVLETTQVETNMKQAEVNRLPINRNPIAVAGLAPGTNANGINGTVISGAMSYDNLWLVNGAVVNENLRGQPHALYIEDAIQETTVLSGGVSAEYGRFTGGVVSAITKSGGNEFSGSLRDSLDNPRWTAKSIDTQATPISHINETYEATLGGRIVRDRLWFFTAARYANADQQSTLTAVAKLPNPALANYTVANKFRRFEGKLTGQITQKHSLVASYLNNDVKSTNNCQFGCLDFRTIDPQVHNPNNFKTLHYNGILTNSFLVEGDWAKKYFAFVGFGGDQPFGENKSAADLAAGTPAIDNRAGGTGAIFNAPYFCGSCGPETRNNREWELKGRYFLGTHSLGSHNVVAGYDDWAEQRNSNNYQSPTDFRFDVRTNAPVQNPDGTVSIQVQGDPTGNHDRIIWFPIQYSSLGSNLATKSVFVNDKWDLNANFSLNLGARWDKNDAEDSLHNVVSRDSKVSPRLGVIYDVFGNGRLRVDANYGKYVGRLAETVAGGASPAGNPAVYRFAYAGPDLPLQDSQLAIRQVFDWFLANGGTNRQFISASIPGFNTKLLGSLASPNMREITVGAGTQLGKGFVRADYINRNWRDFYAQATTLQTGTVVNPANNQPADLNLITNSDVPKRKYWAAQIQGQYPLPLNFGIGGNYTYSKLTGNIQGETSGSGPVTYAGTSVAYPEYENFAQNAPIGFLAEDQRHKLRIWGDWTLGTQFGRFNLGLLERFDSGLPYSAVGTISIPSAMLKDANGNPIYPNGAPRDPAHQYANGPTAVTYFFSSRGAYRADNLIATDLALNYELPIHGVGLFAKGEVRNVFNHRAVTNPLRINQVVNTAANKSYLTPFNPFTQTPIACAPTASTTDCKAAGANYQLSPLFGQATGLPTTFTQNGSYQLPRTYLASVGVRF